MQIIPAQQALTVDGGSYKLLPISEIKQYINRRIRCLPEGCEWKIVTCDAEGFQRVFWINTSDFEEFSGEIMQILSREA